MTIPNDPKFESTLSGIHLTSDAPDRLTDIFIHRDPAAPPDFGENFKYPLFLRYPESNLKPSAVRRLICRELAHRGHPSNDWIAISVLGLMAESRGAAVSAVDHANYCLDRISETTFHHSIAKQNAPCSDKLFQIECGDVYFEYFNPSKILYWLTRAGVSHFVTDPDKLEGCLSFRRKPFTVKTINWEDIAHSDAPLLQRNNEQSMLIVNEYYSSVFQYFIPELRDLVIEGSVVFEAGGLHLFGDSFFHMPGDTHFGLFSWKLSDGKSYTWAVQQIIGDSYQIQAMSPKGFSIRTAWLREKFGFSGFYGNSALEGSVKSFCRMLQGAQRNLDAKKSNEAFLQFVIGLDLLFGADGTVTESISRRTAMLVYQQRGVSFNEQYVRLQKLYNERSNYVHQGKSIDEADLEEIENICVHVLWCLLDVIGQGKVVNMVEFIQKIDFVAAAQGAGERLEKHRYASLGIPQSGKERNPPLTELKSGIGRSFKQFVYQLAE